MSKKLFDINLLDFEYDPTEDNSTIVNCGEFSFSCSDCPVNNLPYANSVKPKDGWSICAVALLEYKTRQAAKKLELI